MNVETQPKNHTRPRRRGQHSRAEDRTIDTKPILRRLRGGVGRVWDELYSELCQHPLMRRPDGRAEGEAAISEHVSAHQADRAWTTFFVDEGGILRQRPDNTTVKPAKAPDHDQAALDAFLAGRVIGERSGNLFWFDPIPRDVKTFQSVCKDTGRPKYTREPKTYFRQGRPLDEEEVETFAAFPALERRNVLNRAPTAIDSGLLAK